MSGNFSRDFSLPRAKVGNGSSRSATERNYGQSSEPGPSNYPGALRLPSPPPVVNVGSRATASNGPARRERAEGRFRLADFCTLFEEEDEFDPVDIDGNSSERTHWRDSAEFPIPPFSVSLNDFSIPMQSASTDAQASATCTLPEAVTSNAELGDIGPHLPILSFSPSSSLWSLSADPETPVSGPSPASLESELKRDDDGPSSTAYDQFNLAFWHTARRDVPSDFALLDTDYPLPPSSTLLEERELSSARARASAANEFYAMPSPGPPPASPPAQPAPQESRKRKRKGASTGPRNQGSPKDTVPSTEAGASRTAGRTRRTSKRKTEKAVQPPLGNAGPSSPGELDQPHEVELTTLVKDKSGTKKTVIRIVPRGTPGGYQLCSDKVGRDGLCRFPALGDHGRRCNERLVDDIDLTTAHIAAHERDLGLNRSGRRDRATCGWCEEAAAQHGNFRRHILGKHLMITKSECPCGGSFSRGQQPKNRWRHEKTAKHQRWLREAKAEAARSSGCAEFVEGSSRDGGLTRAGCDAGSAIQEPDNGGVKEEEEDIENGGLTRARGDDGSTIQERDDAVVKEEEKEDVEDVMEEPQPSRKKRRFKK